jgi:ABC-type amino acid transport substrate-binding protein
MSRLSKMTGKRALRCAATSIGMVLLMMHAGPIAAQETAQALKACMAQDNPPLSYAVQVGGQEQPRGLDVRVAQAIAAQLKRPLQVVLFESKYEENSQLTHEVNAMLMSGVCDIASGFPLFAADLGAPSRPTARVPDHPGAKRRAQRDWVPLGALAASPGYHVAAMGLVVREAAREKATLAEPGDARIGVIAGTMAGTAVTLFRNGKLRPLMLSLSQNEDALALLEAGRFDATLVSLDRFDAWRLAHPASVLRRAAYVHPLRINIGFVARADAPELLAAANQVITRALADGDLQRWAQAEGSSWIAPAEPQQSGPVGIAELRRE